jgi:hypothetical protein
MVGDDAEDEVLLIRDWLDGTASPQARRLARCLTRLRLWPAAKCLSGPESKCSGPRTVGRPKESDSLDGEAQLELGFSRSSGCRPGEAMASLAGRECFSIKD